MPKGILVFGGNGCGKTTLGRELARMLQYTPMDIEDYSFEKAEPPYSKARSREDCLARLLEDLEKAETFVLSAVKGDFGREINAMYAGAVYLTAPLELRLERIKRRAYEQHGERICKGGDMYEQEQRFFEFVAKRSLTDVEDWAKNLHCPVWQVDAAKPIGENAQWIVSQYRALHR